MTPVLRKGVKRKKKKRGLAAERNDNERGVPVGMVKTTYGRPLGVGVRLERYLKQKTNVEVDKVARGVEIGLERQGELNVGEGAEVRRVQ